MKRWIAALCAGLLTLGVQAQGSQPTLRVVVPYGPGGGTDILARLMAPQLGALLGQQVVVENKGGAGSRIGTQDVARAAPDGQTLLFVDTAFTTNPSLYAKMSYDSVRDFAPVSLLASAPVILVVHPSMPAQNLKELVALGKKKPLQSASSGPGSATSLGTDLFASVAGIQIQQIPYKGVGPAMADVLGGQVPMIVTGISSAKQHVDGGKLRAIAVTGDKRPVSMPNVPTFTEAGVPGVEAASYWGALAPAGTPSATIERLSRAMAQVIRMPEISQKLGELGFNPIGGTAEEFRTNIQTETARWAAVIKATGVKLED
ncbi:MAG: tripartite tricarboxylate transporter substrate binding protein [Rhizobacter sp.]|nr:tripartite tricarboxylate transporter substrate binding protein [Rhizobacter sp.]